VGKVGGTLTVSKQNIHRFHMKRFNFKKLNEVEAKEQYLVELWKRFASVENLDAGVGVRAYQTISKNIKISAKESLGQFELKKYNPWFNEGCSKLLAQRKQAKLQRLQHPSKVNLNNLNNIRHEASRHVRNNKWEYLKENVNGRATNSKYKNIRDLYGGINEFKKGYYQL
jgi:hypothetical protein